MKQSAKYCAAIGTDTVSYKVYNISHINTVMCINITGVSFIDSFDNGGSAVKLGNYRAQSYKISQRKVNET